MPVAGRGSNGDPWRDRGWSASPTVGESARAIGSVAPDDEVAAIIRRAAGLGIPAWRIAAALGLPLPLATS